ncbi:hypothetical protein ACXYTJ_04715 [Gilvimarinus sp. F26214L]|uniref:hypothetical protein n=1 Tax=Gilvimarinus sp. DZF01 TaxID=3461371 RepID=UPI0040453A37
MLRLAQSTIACLTLFLFAQWAVAATVAEEQQRLQALQQSLAKQEASLNEMQTEMGTYPPKLADAQAQVQNAERELATGRKELAELKEQAASDPTPKLEREIPLKEHAVRMLERRVRSETRMLERYQRYRDNLQEDIAQVENDVTQLKRRISEQRRRVAAAQAAPTPKATAGTPAPIRAPEQKAPAASTQSEAVASAAPEPQRAAKPELSSADYEAFQLATATMDRVEKLVASKPGTNPRYTSLELSGSDIENVPFTHLGADQYQAEVVLPSGSQRFRIDSLRFRATISTENAGETYVFIVDARDRHRLKANYFKKSLLAYRGTEPVLATRKERSTEPELETVELASGELIQLSEEDAYALEIAREHAGLLSELNAGQPQAGGASFTISGNSLDSAEMEHLGQDQYRAELKVQSGRQSVKINRSSFRIEIPEADEGEIYLFFVDASRPTRLQLTYYKKSLLDYL